MVLSLRIVASIYSLKKMITRDQVSKKLFIESNKATKNGRNTASTRTSTKTAQRHLQRKVDLARLSSQQYDDLLNVSLGEDGSHPDNDKEIQTQSNAARKESLHSLFSQVNVTPNIYADEGSGEESVAVSQRSPKIPNGKTSSSRSGEMISGKVINASNQLPPKHANVHQRSPKTPNGKTSSSRSGETISGKVINASYQLPPKHANVNQQSPKTPNGKTSSSRSGGTSLENVINRIKQLPPKHSNVNQQSPKTPNGKTSSLGSGETSLEKVINTPKQLPSKHANVNQQSPKPPNGKTSFSRSGETSHVKEINISKQLTPKHANGNSSSLLDGDTGTVATDPKASDNLKENTVKVLDLAFQDVSGLSGNEEDTALDATISLTNTSATQTSPQLTACLEFWSTLEDLVLRHKSVHYNDGTSTASLSIKESESTLNKQSELTPPKKKKYNEKGEAMVYLVKGCPQVTIPLSMKAAIDISVPDGDPAKMVGYLLDCLYTTQQLAAMTCDGKLAGTSRLPQDVAAILKVFVTSKYNKRKYNFNETLFKGFVNEKCYASRRHVWKHNPELVESGAVRGKMKKNVRNPNKETVAKKKSSTSQKSRKEKHRSSHKHIENGKGSMPTSEKSRSSSKNTHSSKKTKTTMATSPPHDKAKSRRHVQDNKRPRPELLEPLRQSEESSDSEKSGRSRQNTHSSKKTKTTMVTSTPHDKSKSKRHVQGNKRPRPELLASFENSLPLLPYGLPDSEVQYFSSRKRMQSSGHQTQAIKRSKCTPQPEPSNSQSRDSTGSEDSEPDQESTDGSESDDDCVD